MVALIKLPRDPAVPNDREQLFFDVRQQLLSTQSQGSLCVEDFGEALKTVDVTDEAG